MFCNKCGNKINDGVLFCPKCGNSIKAPQAPATVQATEQAKPVTPQQKETPKPQVAPKPQPTKQPKPVEQPKEEKATPVKKKKKGGKIVLIILALLLVFGLVIGSAIPVAVCAIINISETKAEGVTYTEDFPVLKNQTDLYVYDEVKFPVEAYEIKVEKFIIGGAIKDICAKSEVIVDTSYEPIYTLDLADGDYRITLTEKPSALCEEILEDMLDDYIPEYENVVDDYISVTETASVIIIDVKVDGEDEGAIDAVNLDGQLVSEPVEEPTEEPEENTDDADKFIEATDADYEELKTLLPIIYYYDFDCTTLAVDYFVDNIATTPGGLGVLYMYYFEEYPTDDWWEAEQKYYYSEPDPERRFPEYCDCIRLPKKNVKWLCEEVFNVEFDENYISEESYVYGDYVYKCVGGVGDGGDGWDEYDFVNTTIVDGKYQFVIEHYFCYNEGDGVVRDLLSTKQITAEIKVKDDGERFWSYYEIKEITSDSES